MSLSYTFQEIGLNLNVDASTVYRTVALFQQTGSVTKRIYSKDRLQRKITPTVELIILNIVISKPGLLLYEIKNELQQDYGVELCESTICQFLHKSGFSRQKMVIIAKQRDSVLREKYTLDVSIYQPHMFIFMDETGADRRNLLRKYSYSLRGKPAENQEWLLRGERISVISIMSMEGLLDSKVFYGTVDGDDTYDFVTQCLLPHIQPFDGYNPHSVVILDNASVHHVPEVSKAIENMGAIVHYLPPYSPDYNPIEELFSKVKTIMKQVDKLAENGIDIVALSAFATITQQDCRNWIKSVSIYGN